MKVKPTFYNARIAGLSCVAVFILLLVSTAMPYLVSSPILNVLVHSLVLFMVLGSGVFAVLQAGGKHNIAGTGLERHIFIIFCLGILLHLSVQIFQLSQAPILILLKGILTISLPLLVMSLMQHRLNPWHYFSLLSIATLVYALSAVQTWIGGSLGFVAGISPDWAGWYYGSALLGCLIYLNAGILGHYMQCRWPTLLLQLLMAILVLAGGSSQAIVWLFVFSLFVLFFRITLAPGKDRLKKTGLIVFVLLVIMSISPFFFANAPRRTARSYPLPYPIVASDELPRQYAEAIADNHLMGYLSYQDIHVIDQSLSSVRISKERSNQILQNYLTMRFETPSDDLQLQDLKNRQFFLASNQSSSLANRLFGFGLAWFDGFLDPVHQGLSQLIAIWGWFGLFILLAPFIQFGVLMFRRQNLQTKNCMFLIDAALLMALLFLTLLVWDGIILQPFLLVLVYLPLLLLQIQPEKNSGAPTKATESKNKNQAKKWSYRIILPVLFLLIVFFGLFWALRSPVMTSLRQGYRFIYQGNKQLMAVLSELRPGKWKSLYIPPDKEPMAQYEAVPNESIADAFLRGRYMGYIFGQTIDWDLPGISNPSIQYSYHSMFWLNSCLRAWQQSQDPEYMQAALEAVFSWLDRFPVKVSDDPPYAWNDDSTARRVFYLCDAYEMWYSEMTEKQRGMMLNALTYQADLLSQGHFYTWHHNHGLFQDRALLRYTQVIDDPNNARYIALCKDRIMTYVQSAVTPDGVNTEHSPSYHLVIVDLLLNMADFTEAVDSSFSQLLRDDIVDGMRDYATWLTRPDGSYPPLGDSGTRMTVIPRWLSDPYYQYVATLGKEGLMPESLDRVYPHGGYAIFRNSWMFEKETTWVMFVAATHSGSHKHHDDLSFMIWHKGDLFTDGGNGGYDYFGDTLALYGVSPWAHSTLVTNWLDRRNARFYKYRPLIDERGLETGIIDWSIEDDFATVTGIQKRIPGIEQIRSLTYDKQKNKVIISDEVTSLNKSDNHLFLFQLAKDIEPVTEKDKITLLREGQPTATISFNSSLPYEVFTRYGDEDPLIRSFCAETGAARYLIGVQFDDVTGPLQLLTEINLLP